LLNVCNQLTALGAFLVYTFSQCVFVSTDALEGVAVSTGSACHSGSVQLSPKAMKVPPEIGMGAIRFSLGRTTTREEIEQVVSWR
jgi:cysteine sulfinate desulfinase/cysteine desulfurase-like protein